MKAFFVLFIFSPFFVFAQSKVKTFDFEEDVIRVEKKAPHVFMQSTLKSLELDEIIYLRKDFNDFHEQDANWHSHYIENKRVRGGKKRR